MNTKHTPETQWTARLALDGSGTWIIEDESECYVGETTLKARALRIVKAVNAHDELVGALDLVLEKLETTGEYPGIAEHIRATLAKAKVGEGR